MSARFAELMAMSAAQTRDSDATTQRILEDKRRKDEQRKKEQLEAEKKERELFARLARKKIEDERREEERKRKAEEDRHRKEQVVAMREAEQRKNLMYGKDRKSGWGSSGGGGGGGGGGRSRKAAGSDDDDDGAGTQVLTREEKRQRKLNADLNKSFTSTRRSYGSPGMQGMRKPSRTVGGGDPSHQRVSEASSSRLTETRHSKQMNGNNAIEPGNSMLSVRKQLASMPPALMKLGAAKRDQRTIDEIVTDLHKKKEAKVIEGDEARRNGDWFGEQKKLGNVKKATSGSSLSPSPEARDSQPPSGRPRDHGLASKTSSLSLGRTTPTSSQAPERKEPRTKVTMIKPEQGGSLSFSKNSSTSMRTTVTSSKPSISQSSKAATSAGKTHLAGSSLKKRGRSYSDYDSDSLDDSPPPTKRRPAASSGRNDISSEIWKLFGKDRNQYMQNDVYSDEDDDMEADADALRREELRSARLAKKEDEAAAEEEKRHEEYKRRKRREKEMKGY